MSRKAAVLIATTLIVALSLAGPAQAAKSYAAERFDVNVEVQADGSLLVTETVDFRFEGGPFTYVFREIALTETDGAQVLQATLDGVPLAAGAQAGQAEIVPGDPIRVTWHFAPTSDATHTFELRYQVWGAIRRQEADTLIWRAIPQEHDYSIARSTISLTYPTEARPVAPATLDRSFEAASMPGGLRLTTTGIAEDEAVILTARFAAGSLVQGSPQWQQRSERAAAATASALPFGFLAGFAALVLGGAALAVTARAHQRQLDLPPLNPIPTPPANVPPAVIGRLTGQALGFMGTLFDLAQHGVLEIDEETGWLGTKKHALVSREAGRQLSPYEQALLSVLFRSGEARLSLSEAGSRLAARQDPLNKLLDAELVERGWLDPERQRQRTRLSVGWILALAAGLMLLVAGTATLAAAVPGALGLAPVALTLAGLGVGTTLVSVIGLIYAGTFSVFTPLGEEQAVRWKGFQAYLKQASRGREPAIRPDMFELYLPFAAVFGLGTAWARYFQKLGGVPLPVWFHAAAGSQGDFGAIVAIMAASDSAGASSGGAGGAGASGGGASGAG